MSQGVDQSVDPLDRTVDLDRTVEINALAPPPAQEAEEAGAAPRTRLKSAIFWSYALTAGRLGTTTIVTFVLAKMLGPHALGVVTTALLFVMITQMLLQQTLLTTIIQREQLDDDHLDAGFWLVIGGSLALTALAAGLAPLWAAFNDQPQLTMICIALTPMILLQGLTVVPEAILRRKMTFRPLAIRTLIATAIGGVVGIGMAFAGYQAWALVAQQLVTAGVGAVVLWSVTDWRPHWRLPRRAARDLWGFSSQTALGGVGVFLAIRMDVLVIGKFFGANATGLYRIAQRLPDMLTEVTSRSLQQVSLPELARLQKQPVELGDRLAKMLHVSAVTGLPALGILAATAKPLVALLGPEWSPAGTAMQLLCIVGIVNVYGVLLGPALQAVGRPGINTALSWFQLVVGVTTFYFIGQLLNGSTDDRAQVAAIALGMSAVELSITILMMYITFVRVLKVNTWQILGPTVPAFVAGAAGFLVPFLIDRSGMVGGPWVLKFVVYGVLATGISAGLLLGLDGRTRGMVMGKLGTKLGKK
ncbi:lipopolysaccharide biosynthesis protein [Dactylosporangium aurantiacum]|uniref:Lipopolysaccharide biosynthesis protein n=1 Tax=Dactylosporangium aurantiacum TaxID=35754 RepID=A0A9Q9MNP7_9ACTN|nr:lipopolysaccharide biosynthesis protein [Dactylosporangium aurantiacum]MDG6106037.1 lipopolysaccharide biosynthesis protein [Dactylosporangium aurantiacum]UWZ55917.1 lipopolysaccharide biosynthesis protein [Dactylosporangium aurantiacum]